MASLISYQKGYEDLDGDNVDVDLSQVHLGSLLDSPDSDTPKDERQQVAAQALVEDTYTVGQAVDAIGFGKFQIKLSLFTGLAWMADSMEMMILSILSPALRCYWGLKTWQQALITTVVFCGMMLSSSFWGSICDKYGRRKALMLSSVITFYFGCLSAFSPTFIWLLVLRGFVGFGIGGAPQSVTLYSEFLPSKIRAKAIILIELAWAIGACFEVLLALVVMPTLGWRWLLAFSALPLILFAASCFWVPESARFDVARGRYDLAQQTLERIARENGKPLPLGRLVSQKHVENPDKSSKEIEEENKNTSRGAIWTLFSPELRTTTCLLWVIWFANAFSYYGTVLMTTELFSNGDQCHGGSAVMASKKMCMLDCVPLSTKDYVDLLWTTLAEFPGLFVTALVIDIIGRKWTMCAEFLVYAIFTFLVAICLTRPPLTAFLFVSRAFISGCFQAAFVYTPEVYPTTARAIGLGTSSMMARIGCIITPFVAQVLVSKSVGAAVGIYGSVCVVAAGASLLLPIETKGRAMQEDEPRLRRA